jgi:hypothetical protein
VSDGSAEAEPDFDSSVRDMVDGQDLSRESGRVPHRNLRHARRNLDAVRRLRHPGE